LIAALEAVKGERDGLSRVAARLCDHWGQLDWDAVDVARKALAAVGKA
jgi:hypothetical protein